MFDAIPAWGWVALAWGELILAYLGYLGYLRWRRRRLERERLERDLAKEGER